MTTTDTIQSTDGQPGPPNPYRTVWTIIKSPGVVSHEFIAGNKGKYVHPRGVFLFFALAFFLISFGNRTTPDLYTQMNNLPYSSVAKHLVEKKIKEKKTNIKAFEESYQSKAVIVGLWLLFLMTWLFAFALLFVNRNKSFSFSNHEMVSYELMTLLMMCWFVILPWFREEVSVYLLILILLGLLYLFQRNTYKQGIFRSMSNAALLAVVFLAVVVIYRAGVFFLTITIWQS